MEETRENLQAIIDKVRSAYPQVKIVLAGMMVPPNMGPDYGKAFQKIYPELAAKNKTALIPFLLEGVGVVGPCRIDPGEGLERQRAGDSAKEGAKVAVIVRAEREG